MIPAGSLLDPCWIPAGSLLDPCWIPTGFPLDPCWIPARSLLDPYWIPAGSLLAVLEEVRSQLGVSGALQGDIRGKRHRVDLLLTIRIVVRSHPPALLILFVRSQLLDAIILQLATH